MTRPRYRADPPALRRTIALDDGMTLIFHRPSATTHVVAAPVPEILAALGEEPATADQLVERLAADYDLDRAAADAVAAHLDEFAALGLVTRE